MSSKLYLGSIDLKKIDKSKIKVFERANGEKGASLDVAVWINDSPDEDWKAMSIQQSTTKEEAKIYLGNGKLNAPKTPVNDPQASGEAIAADEKDDLPF